MKLLEHFHELSLHPKNAKELKGLILQLAVQGKLTKKWREENPELISGENSAEALLKRVKEEKARWVQEKQMRKEKPIPVDADEEQPFLLPEQWVWCHLNDISHINGGLAFKSSNYQEEGVRVIRISDFDENGFKDNKVVRYEYSEEFEPFKLEEKNILMAMTGGTVGKSLFVKSLKEPMVVNQRVATIKLLPFIAEAYVNCVIPTDLVQKVIAEAKNSTNDNISMSDIKGFYIPLPPLPEQKAIVSIVEQLFTEVEQLEQLTEKRIKLKEDFASSALSRVSTSLDTTAEWEYLQPHFHSFFNEESNIKKLRETILQLAVQGKLTQKWRAGHGPCLPPGGVVTPERDRGGIEHAAILLERIKAEKARLVKEGKIRKEKPLPPVTEDEVPYELPEGWVWCRMGEAFAYGNRIKRESTDVNQDTWVLELEDVEKESSKLIQKVRYSDRKFKSTKSYFEPGDVIYGKLRPYLDKVIVADENGVCTTEMIPIKSFGNTEPEYLKWFLKNPMFIEYANNSTHGMSLPRLGTEKAIEAIVALPPLEEQKAIVAKVNSLMALCDELEEQVNKGKQQSEDLMQAVVRKVFEGEKEYLQEGGVKMAAEGREEYNS